jgi:hypothetical protein
MGKMIFGEFTGRMSVMQFSYSIQNIELQNENNRITEVCR